MNRVRAAALLLGATVTAWCAAACDGGTSDDGAPTTRDEQDINVLELKCRNGERASETRFDVAPAFGGTALEGRLKTEEGETSFICRAPSSSSGAGSNGAGSNGAGSRGATSAASRNVVVTCTERPQSVHSGRWTVEVTADAAGHHARIDRAALVPNTPDKVDDTDGDGDGTNGIGPDESLACARTSVAEVIEPYANIADYVHRACGVCHDDRFDSLAKIHAQRDLMLGMISSRAMPRRNPAWLDGAEGKAVLAFLAKSPELE